MATSSSSNIQTHTYKDQDNSNSNSKPISKPNSSTNRRTQSFSSSSSRSNSWDDSSSFSFNEEEFSNYCPSISPIRSFKGIPFSWEQNPGIPKTNRSFKKKNKDDMNSIANDHLLLPLPPVKLHGNQESNLTIKKYNSMSKLRKDPFFAAMVECSKDDRHRGSKILKGSTSSKSGIFSRSLSDKFGFFDMYASCKSACDVSESTVYLPIKPRPHYLLNYRH